MMIEVDKRAGFCRGVMSAIRKSEEASSLQGKVFSLGPLVHNEKEVERLEKAGIRVVSHDDLKHLKQGSVIIRAHGEPPGTYQLARDAGLEVIDATCPVVLKVQEKIRAAAERVKKEGGMLLIYGKDGHPEVTGLLGQTGGIGRVVTSPGDLPEISPGKPVFLFSQTTMPGEGFDLLAGKLKDAMADGQECIIHKTICGQVYGRAPKLREFAARHDVVLFMSGRESSNGKYLFEVCKSVNPRSYLFTWLYEFRKEWLSDAESVGISGAASTPLTDLEELAEKIKKEM